MNDEKLKELLKAYEVPQACPGQIQSAAEKARASLGRAFFTRPFSFWMQIKVQAVYLSKWFYISCAAIALLCLFLSRSAESGNAVFFGMSPLFALPCSAAVYRAVSSGMSEIEASCRYRMTKLFVSRLIVLGTAVSSLIFAASIPSAFFEGGYSPRPLLLAFISFTLTSAVILWFGKRSMLRGIVCGAAWSAGIFFISVSEKYRLFITEAGTETIIAVFLFGLTAVTLTAYRYIKEISYEGVHGTWNCSSTV